MKAYDAKTCWLEHKAESMLFEEDFEARGNTQNPNTVTKNTYSRGSCGGRKLCVSAFTLQLQALHKWDKAWLIEQFAAGQGISMHSGRSTVQLGLSPTISDKRLFWL